MSEAVSEAVSEALAAAELPAHTAAALRAAAIHLHERYSVEIVERFGICPWARRARELGEVRRVALLQRDLDPQPTLSLLDELEANPVPVAIVLFPLLLLDPRGFDAFAARLREAEQARKAGRPMYVSATFHPDYPLDSRSPGRLVPFLRRSPDPSLQLVRLDILDEARGGREGKFLFDGSSAAWAEVMRRVNSPPLAERIAIDNLATVEREGPEALEAVYRSIAEERARLRAELGL